MAKYDLVADVSSHNPDSIEFFRKLAKLGVKAVIVKLTEGSNPGSAYFNPKAMKQVQHTAACGMRVHAYHFSQFLDDADAILEALWFIEKAKQLNLGRDSVMAVDCESSALPFNITSSANAFLSTVKSAGYPQTDVYTATSWFWEGRINPDQLIAKNLWVASYGVSQPGVDNVGTWQFTDNFCGLHVDMSYGFSGHYTGKQAPSEEYVVQPGDSWWLIAYNHNLDMNALAALNGQTIHDTIHPGQKIKVR